VSCRWRAARSGTRLSVSCRRLADLHLVDQLPKQKIVARRDEKFLYGAESGFWWYGLPTFAFGGSVPKIFQVRLPKPAAFCMGKCGSFGF